MNYLDSDRHLIRHRDDYLLREAQELRLGEERKAAGELQAAFGTVTCQQLGLAEHALAATWSGALKVTHRR